MQHEPPTAERAQGNIGRPRKWPGPRRKGTRRLRPEWRGSGSARGKTFTTADHMVRFQSWQGKRQSAGRRRHPPHAHRSQGDEALVASRSVLAGRTGDRDMSKLRQGHPASWRWPRSGCVQLARPASTTSSRSEAGVVLCSLHCCTDQRSPTISRRPGSTRRRRPLSMRNKSIPPGGDVSHETPLLDGTLVSIE